MSAPDLSLVVPARDEAGNVGPLVAEIRAVLDAAGLTWEAWLIDDGSRDGTWQEISRAVAADSRVSGIRQPGPTGKSAALAAGFSRTRGDIVVMLDGDGQDDPAGIPKLVEPLRSDPRVGLVNGWKTPRLDPWHKTLPSRVFNMLLGAVSGLRLHDHNCGLKAIRGSVARRLRLDRDMHRFIPVLVWLDGHRVREMPVHHRPRVLGRSKYGLGRFFSGVTGLGRVARLVHGGGAGTPRREPRSRVRHGVYTILAALALGGVLGRIGSVASVDRVALEKRLVEEAVAKATTAGLDVDPEQLRRRIEGEKRLLRPFLSANDRSRWLTMRALVERGGFAIDDLVVEPGWDTIDAVAHPDRSGRLRLYSSKPPLLSVLCAGPYWILHRLTGWTLGDHPFEVGRLLMILFGLVPLAVTIAFTCRLIEAVGSTDWGRAWAAALIAGGTLLTTFAVVLTNHLFAAACVAISAWLVLRIGRDGLRSRRSFAAAGLFSALAAAFELPALAWLTMALLLAARSSLRRTLEAMVPAVAAVALAALAANLAAHGTAWPPYAFRAPATEHGPVATAAVGHGWRSPAEGESWNPANWYDFRIRLPNGRLLESYWRHPRGVDRGEPSRVAYGWHMLFGHHGIFSLTPAWLLAIPGIWLLARGAGGRAAADLARVTAAVSALVIVFYLMRPLPDRNYGGVTSGFRWVFWLAPLWVMATVPAVDRLARSRAGRTLALVLLALSAVSVAFPTWNPWSPPWIEQWLRHGGWLPGR